jgi:hypothetical protein
MGTVLLKKARSRVRMARLTGGRRSMSSISYHIISRVTSPHHQISHEVKKSDDGRNE